MIRVDKIFERETAMILALKEKNCINLFSEVKPSTYKTFIAIRLYLTELLHSVGYRWKKYQDEDVVIGKLRNNNKIKITVEMLKEYNGACVHKEDKKTSYETRRQLKILVKENVLHPLGNDYYFINPKFLYVGDTWDTCYFDWCRITGEEYDEALANPSRKRYSVKAGRTIEAPSRSMIELGIKLGIVYGHNPELDLPSDILDRVEAVSKDSSEVQDLIESKQQKKLKEERINYYKSNQTTNIFINMQCIEELGIETAKECIEDPAFFNIALNELQTQTNDLPF